MRDPPTKLMGDLSQTPFAFPSKQCLLRHPIALGRVLVYSCHRCLPPASLALSMLALSSRHCLLSVSALTSCLPLNCLSFTQPAACCVASRCAASASCCAVISCPIDTWLSSEPLPLVVSASHRQLASYILSASHFQPASPLVTSTSIQLVPLILSRQVDCHIIAASSIIIDVLLFSSSLSPPPSRADKWWSLSLHLTRCCHLCCHFLHVASDC